MTQRQELITDGLAIPSDTSKTGVWYIRRLQIGRKRTIEALLKVYFKRGVFGRRIASVCSVVILSRERQPVETLTGV
jgi:hypothetical protein